MSLLSLVLTLQVSASLSPDTTRLRQRLPDIAVRATRRVLPLRAPGKTKGLYTAFGRELPPTQAVAVWHGPPDTSRVYVVRAVRVRLGSRFPEAVKDLPKARRNFSEGAVRLWLSPGTLAGGPQPNQNLLAAPLLLAADAPAQKGWVRFEVAPQRVVLPAGGLFIVAEGITTDGETYERTRDLVRPPDGKTPPEDVDFKKMRQLKGSKGVEVFRYAELRRPDGSTRLAGIHDFPALAHRLTTAPADCHTWVLRLKQPEKILHWLSLTQSLAPFRKSNPDASMSDYNYELELEVEEL